MLALKFTLLKNFKIRIKSDFIMKFKPECEDQLITKILHAWKPLQKSREGTREKNDESPDLFHRPRRFQCFFSSQRLRRGNSNVGKPQQKLSPPKSG